jgi:hypothetical protein
MMSNVSRSIFVGAAIAMALAGCQRTETPASTSNGGPAQTAVSAAEVPKQPSGDASVPSSTAVAATKDAADKATSTQEVNAMQHKAAPQEPMSKAEESKGMPLPGQANDHSTTALEKK